MSAWERVQKARRIDRPTAIDYINKISEDFIELHGDRLFGDDPSIIGGIGRIGNINVTIIAQEKGKNTKDKIKRNFAMPNPEGYRKALRLMKQAEKFHRPIICFVDTPGAYPGIGAEERGQGEAIARNLLEMSQLETPIISIVIGEGGSGGALALAVADRVWMLENSIYSILSPEGYASILYKNSRKAQGVAEEMKLTSEDLFSLGIIDQIIKEPHDGAHESFLMVAENLKELLLMELRNLLKTPVEELVERRYERYRSLG